MVTHPHENLNMESQRTGGNNTATSQFITHRREYTLSCSTILLLGAFFVCTLLTVSFVVYNFATCDDIIPNEDEDIVCTAIPMKHKVNEQNETDTAQRTYEQDVRLPTSIKPLKYNISLEPYLYEGNFTFNGEVHIHILVLEDCYNVTMHAIDLEISKNDVAIQALETKSDKKRSKIVKEDRGVNAAGAAELRIRKQYLLEAKQFFIIELYDKLLKNTKYVIKIKFSGLIQDYLQGFYRSSYKVRNETRYICCRYLYWVWKVSASLFYLNTNETCLHILFCL